MAAKCIIRLEYYSEDEDDIQKELKLLDSVGWEVVTTDMGNYSKLRKTFNQIITLAKKRE